MASLSKAWDSVLLFEESSGRAVDVQDAGDDSEHEEDEEEHGLGAEPAIEHESGADAYGNGEDERDADRTERADRPHRVRDRPALWRDLFVHRPIVVRQRAPRRACWRKPGRGRTAAADRCPARSFPRPRQSARP